MQYLDLADQQVFIVVCFDALDASCNGRVVRPFATHTLNISGGETDDLCLRALLSLQDRTMKPMKLI